MQQTTPRGQAVAARNAEPATIPEREIYPYDGKARAKQSANFLGVGLSTFWLYVKQERIKRPMRYGPRVSVWDAQYIRSLANNGIPPAGTEAAK